MSCNIDQIPRQKPQSRRLERAPSTCQCKWMGFWFFFYFITIQPLHLTEDLLNAI